VRFGRIDRNPERTKGRQLNILQYAISLKDKLSAKGKAFNFFQPGKTLSAVVANAEEALGEARPASVVFPGGSQKPTAAGRPVAPPVNSAPAPQSQSAPVSLSALSEMQARIAALEQANAGLTAKESATQAEITRLTGELTTAKAVALDAQADAVKTRIATEAAASARALDILAAAGGAPLRIGSEGNPYASLGKPTDGMKGFTKVQAAFKKQITKSNQ
jgi:hypothetical protein